MDTKQAKKAAEKSAAKKARKEAERLKRKQEDGENSEQEDTDEPPRWGQTLDVSVVRINSYEQALWESAATQLHFSAD